MPNLESRLLKGFSHEVTFYLFIDPLISLGRQAAWPGDVGLHSGTSTKTVKPGLKE